MHLDEWHLFEPFWRSATSWRESLFFVREAPGVPPSAPLLFEPGRIARLGSATGLVAYAEGRDFEVDAAGRRIVLTPESRIPHTESADLYRTADQDHGIDHRVGDEAVKLLFGEGHYFHDLQAEVTYEHVDPWDGCIPAHDRALLPRTAARLTAGEPLRICLSGDSISAGANASGFTGAAPGLPPYGDLVARALECRTGSAVSFTNLAVGGKGAAHGIEVAEQAARSAPDLMLIAYGMNDVGRGDPRGFREQIEAGMAIVRRSRPQVEFILVAPMLGNPEWVHTPADAFAAHRDALAGLCGEGTALADVTSLWTDLLRRKRYHDLTGNGVNHPNDYGHRVYAQALLSLLVGMDGAD